MPDLCEGCDRCPLADPWYDGKRSEVGGGCAPPTGPLGARILVVGEAPGREEVLQGQPFVGASGRMLRAALLQFGIDPETEVRYVNTVQCRPPHNRDPEPLEAARCTVLERELANFQGRVVLAVGRVGMARLVGEPYLKLLNRSRSSWDGYAHDPKCLHEHSLGSELGFFGETYLSGKRKGEPKQTRRPIAVATPVPESVRAVVGCLHPASVMRQGFSTKAQFLAAVQRACMIAQGFDPPSLGALAGVEKAIHSPHLWKLPEPGEEIDLITDIENTELGITDISFVEVDSDGGIRQRASFPWTPSSAALARQLVGPGNPYRTVVAHNAAYDFGQLLALEQIEVQGAGIGERGEGLACTMMAAQLDQPDLPKALGSMWRYLPPMPPWKHLSGSNMRLYNLLDSVVTAMAWAVLRRRLTERGQIELLRTEMASIMVLDRMTRNGLPVDVGRLRTWLEEKDAEIAGLKARWHALTGLEVQSGKRVLAWFFEEHQCPVEKRTSTGQPKFDEDIMEKLRAADIPQVCKDALDVLMKWKKLTKLVSTYGRGFESKLDANNYLHPSYLPDIKDSGDLGTAAGRLSSSPNVQNVPEEMRWIFRAPPGWSFGDSDLRAVEGRVQAILAEDHQLLELYDRPGWDMHRFNLRNAKQALRRLWPQCADERTPAGRPSAFSKLCQERLAAMERGLWPITRKNMKTFLYGWNYGAGDPKIAESLGIHIREAAAVREAYEASRPATARWRRAVVRSAASRKLLQNAFGRVRYFPGVVPDVHVRNQAINFFPQSTVADMFWTWFPLVEELLYDHGGLLGTQVHDSFVWLAPSEQVTNIVTELDVIMTQEWPQIAPGFKVPATHDIGPSWGEVVPYDEWLQKAA